MLVKCSVFHFTLFKKHDILTLSNLMRLNTFRDTVLFKVSYVLCAFAVVKYVYMYAPDIDGMYFYYKKLYIISFLKNGSGDLMVECGSR